MLLFAYRLSPFVVLFLPHYSLFIKRPTKLKNQFSIILNYPNQNSMQSQPQMIPLYGGSNPASLTHSKAVHKSKLTDHFFLQSVNIKLFFRNLYLDKSKLSVVPFIIFFMATVAGAEAQNNTWKGISNNWNVAGNWSVGVPTSSSDVILPVLGGTVAFNPVLSATGTCRTIKSMANGTSISGTGTLTIGTAGSTTISGTSTISCPLNLIATTAFSISTSLTISSVISGSGGITKAGTGALNLGSATTTFNTLAINSGTVIMNGNATFSSLTLNGGTLNLAGTTTVTNTLALTSGSLVIGSNTLIANGGITHSSGVLGGSSSSNLTLGGSAAESLYFAASDTVLNNLTLNHSGNTTTTLNTSLEIYGSISFGSSNDNLNLNDQHVTINSDINGTAYVGEIKGTLTNATHVTAERYIDGTVGLNGKRSWRLLSIPITGQTIREAWCGVAANADATPPNSEIAGSGTLITGHGYSNGTLAAAAGYDWFAGLGSNTTSSIRYYNSAHSWSSAYNTPDPLSAPNKQGYMLYVRGDRTVASSTDTGYTTLMPTGTLKQGQQTVSVTDPYTVVGNPYASPIDLDAMYNNSGNSSVIKRNFWVWDATLGTSGSYRILSWNGSSYNITGGTGTASDYLVANSAQAFLVEQQTSGSIIINESNKTMATPTSLFRPMAPTGVVSTIGILLYQAAGNVLGMQTDGVVARYNDIYNVSPYETYDAAKMNNFNENLSLVRNSRYLSIESRPYPTQNDTLFIPFWGLKIRDYAFTITSSKFVGLNQSARLIDGFTNTEMQINLSDATITFPFTITIDPASSSLNRFTIVMSPLGILPVTFTKIKASLTGSKIQVTWNTAGELEVKNYDVEKSTDGIRFSKMDNIVALNATTGASYQWLDGQPFKGNNFYRIRSNDENGRFIYSSIAVVQLTAKKGIKISPTVINNHRFTLSLNEQPAGNYGLTLTNSSGQQVYQKMIRNDGGNNSQVIDMEKIALPAGVYNLSVSGPNGNKQNLRMIINK